MSKGAELEQEIEASFMGEKSPLQWVELTQHLNKWFHKPDLEALEVAMSAVAAHPAITGDPVWLFVQGPSGSGKTEIMINALTSAPNSRVVSSINKHSFFSFYRGDKGGLLTEIGSSGILLFKDFTTILSMRDDERTEVIAQLREIYDGKWSRSSGVGTSDWEGKITCIAACTGKLERAWALKRDMGERFLTVRWFRDGTIELARAAGRQRGHEKSIKERTISLTKAMLSGNKFAVLPSLPDHYFDRIGALSQLVANLRPHVEHLNGKAEVMYVAEAEEPTRIHKSLTALASSHAGLWGRKEVAEDDFRIARRVALDSIPLNRIIILQCFGAEKSAISKADMMKQAKMARSMVDYYVEELKAIGALDSTIMNFDEEMLSISDEYRELLSYAGLQSFRTVLKYSELRKGNKNVPPNRIDRQRIKELGSTWPVLPLTPRGNFCTTLRYVKNWFAPAVFASREHNPLPRNLNNLTRY